MRNGIGRRMRFIGVVALAGVALPVAGYSYGVEIPENGTVPFGRAGAYVARASDPSAVAHNMAGVMGLPGLQFNLSSNVGVFTHCFQRAGTYDAPPNTTINTDNTRFAGPGGREAAYLGQAYPETCKEPSVGLAPQLLFTYRVNRWLAFGAGLTTPSTQGSAQNFPNSVQGTARDGSTFSAPSPARYLLFRKSLLVIYPTLGVAVQPHRMVRLGLTIQPSFASFGFGLHANAVRSEPQSPSSDILIQLNASGFFIAGALSVQLLPSRYLSFGAQVHYNGPIVATGTADTTANVYSTAPVAGSFQINRMEVNLPWNARAGVRFALPRAGRPTQDDGTGTYDPMTDDVFDVEADFNFERTSMLGRTALQNSGLINPAVSGISAPANITIESALSDVMGVRIGGDYNIIPGRLAARLGFSYETRGASPDAAQIHLPAYAGASLHAGVSYRWRWLTINLGIGHFIFQDNDASNGRRAIVVPSDAMGNQISLNRCPEESAQGNGTCTINQGVYRASFTAGSLGFVGRF